MKLATATMGFALAASAATAATSPDIAALAAAVQSNIVAKIEAATAVRKSAVRELLTTNSYQILTSTKLSDAVAKLALQKQLADAALKDFLSTEDGRFRCHGRYVGQTVDLASQTATFTHADGTTYTVAFAVPDLAADVAKANRKLPVAMTTNGVPVKLADARRRRYQEKVDSPSNVTVRVSATTASAPTAEDIAALAAENAARAAALEKAAEEARLFAETNVFEEVEAPITIEGDTTK